MSHQVAPQAVVYRVEAENTLILHVFRGSRDIEALLS
jgi:hypothetical protein